MRTEFYCFSGLLFIMSAGRSRWGDPTSRKKRETHGHPAKCPLRDSSRESYPEDSVFRSLG